MAKKKQQQKGSPKNVARKIARKTARVARTKGQSATVAKRKTTPAKPAKRRTNRDDRVPIAGRRSQRGRDDAIAVAESTFAPALDETIMGDNEHVAHGTEPVPDEAEALPDVEREPESDVQAGTTVPDAADRELRSLFADKPTDDDGDA